MSIFLSKLDLQILTGRRRADAQIRQLKRQGIRFELDADNNPVVIRQTIEQPTERAADEPKLCFPNDKRKLKCVAWGGDWVGGHSLQSPVHSTDLSIVGSPNRSNCPADCAASAFLALAQNLADGVFSVGSIPARFMDSNISALSSAQSSTPCTA